jgi:hypothetical protein
VEGDEEVAEEVAVAVAEEHREEEEEDPSYAESCVGYSVRLPLSHHRRHYSSQSQE